MLTEVTVLSLSHQTVLSEKLKWPRGKCATMLTVCFRHKTWLFPWRWHCTSRQRRSVKDRCRRHALTWWFPLENTLPLGRQAAGWLPAQTHQQMSRSPAMSSKLVRCVWWEIWNSMNSVEKQLGMWWFRRGKIRQKRAWLENFGLLLAMVTNFGLLVHSQATSFLRSLSLLSTHALASSTACRTTGYISQPRHLAAHSSLWTM